MKYSFKHILAATLITLVSSTGCLDIVHAPIYADINGVTYCSDGRVWHDSRYSYDPGMEPIFFFAREIQSKNNNVAYISIRLCADTIKVDSSYFCECCLHSLYTTNGHIRFSQISPLFVGEFNFSVTDSTSNTTYNVTNGKFYLQ